MGNECLATTPNEKYAHYLQQIKVSTLKDLWQTVKIYKLKKIFDAVAVTDPSTHKLPHLDFKAFRSLFVELEAYPEQQLYRLFQIFHFQNTACVDWNNFFSLITILYFGCENNLALIMFMMFDHSLQLKLDNPYLKLMLQTNQPYFKDEQSGLKQDASEVYTLLASEEGLSIQSWLKKAGKFIDFAKFRKIFNIFAQQKMEKELVQNFYVWNQIYDSERDKFIGYLINLKWFQSWRLYISHHYNITLDIYSSTKTTIKTVKTCKKVTSKLRTVKLGIDNSKALHGCRFIEVPNSKNETIMNIDCTHNHLGQRPREITNSQLQGEYQQVLREGVSQNMDYVIVSEKIWNHLKKIYDGFPQFRRTGYDTIELYPKIVKTYFSIFKGQIDYSTEVIRQVSAYLGVDQLLLNTCELKQQDLKSKAIYFKTIGMKDWQELEDYSLALTEISSSILMFLVCIPLAEKDIFLKAHKKVPKDATEANLGDYLLYEDGKEESKTAVFMGKNTEGKYILHFVGELYTNDVCLIESDLLKYCKLSNKIHEIYSEKRHSHLNQVGLPNGPGLSFINSTLQIFINGVKGQLLMMENSQSHKLIYCLARIYSLLSKQVKIEPSQIKDIIEIYLNKYNDFEVGMSYDFIADLFTHIQSQIKEQKLPKLLDKHEIQAEKSIVCGHCHTKMMETEQLWALRVAIPEDENQLYEVVWVPADLSSSPINKYKVKVKRQATLNDFIKALQEAVGTSENTFILTQVHNFDIVRNYHTAQRTTTLRNLKVRVTDSLFAFELKTNLKEFVHSHYNTKVYLEDKQIKKDMFIDCKHQERGWIFGKVMQIDHNQLVNCSMVTVLHKFNKNQSWEITYDVFDETVCRFPHRSSSNCEQYHLRVHQRVFNQANNSMKLINIPLIMVLPSWMRWKQFFYLVYLQVQTFIAEQYSMPLSQVELVKSNSKLKKDTKFDPYKQYKNSSKFPYKLHLTDYQGRCVICYKFLKLIVFKGENDTYCEGCQLSQAEPISWQVKAADLLVCIDWHGKNRYKLGQINESLLTSKSRQQRKNVVCLSSCLENLSSPSTISDSMLCCNVFSQKQVTQRIIKNPNNLTIYLDRVVSEEDGFKKVIKKQIKFPIQQLSFQQQKYKLVGVTSISGENLNIKHNTYLLKGGQEWHQYDGKIVRVVNEKYIEKVCAFVLYYHKIK